MMPAATRPIFDFFTELLFVATIGISILELIFSHFKRLDFEVVIFN
jgi:hypothetical protein